VSGAPRTRAGRADGGAGRRTASGPGRLLVAVYAVFAISASARAGVQLATRLTEAPVPYLLSGLAAAVYVVATVALGAGRRRTAWAAVLVELVGVLAVGAAGLVATGAFPDETVWSGFGRGYGYVPLVLPVLGVAWLWRTGREPGPARG
jgi:hypothetical protein